MTVAVVTVHSSAPVVRKFTADVIAATDGAKVYDLALLKMRKFNMSGKKVSIDVQPSEGKFSFFWQCVLCRR